MSSPNGVTPKAPSAPAASVEPATETLPVPSPAVEAKANPAPTDPWFQLSRLSAVVEGGASQIDAKNQQGQDHAAWSLGGQLGILIPVGKSNQYFLKPHVYGRVSNFEKDLHPGTSNFTEIKGGVGLGVYRQGSWLTLGASLRLGMAKYHADTPYLGADHVGVGGAEVNQNGSLRGFDISSPNIEAAIHGCVYGASVCLNPMIYSSPGADFPLEGGNSIAWNPWGTAVTVTADVAQLWRHRSKSNKSSGVAEQAPVIGREGPPITGIPVGKDGPGAPAQKISVSELVQKSKESLDRATKAFRNTTPVDDAKSEAKKSKPDISLLRAYADNAIDRSNEVVLEAKISADIVAKLQEAYDNSEEGATRAQIQLALKQAQRDQQKIDAGAKIAYTNAKQVLAVYVKKVGKKNADISKVLETPPKPVKPETPKLTEEQKKARADRAEARRKAAADAAAKRAADEEAAKKKAAEEAAKKAAAAGAQPPAPAAPPPAPAAPKPTPAAPPTPPAQPKPTPAPGAGSGSAKGTPNPLDAVQIDGA